MVAAYRLLLCVCQSNSYSNYSQLLGEERQLLASTNKKAARKPYSTTSTRRKESDFLTARKKSICKQEECCIRGRKRLLSKVALDQFSRAHLANVSAQVGKYGSMIAHTVSQRPIQSRQKDSHSEPATPFQLQSLSCPRLPTIGATPTSLAPLLQLNGR